ncbi:MAG: DUF2812 domain-containing protein, partial [Clostridium sp.]
SFFDGVNSDDALNYREYCTAAGWDYICQWEKFQVFSSLKSEEERTPIHTDESIKFKTIMKASLKYISLYLITALMIFFTQMINIVWHVNPYTFSSNFSLMAVVISFVYLSISIINFIYFLVYFIKGKKAIATSGEVEYPHYKTVKVKRTVELVDIIISIGIIVFLMISQEAYISIVVILTILYCVINYLVMKKVSKCNYSKGKKRAINIGTLVVTLIIFYLGIVNSIFSSPLHNDESLNNSSKVLLSLSDFGYEGGEVRMNTYKESVLASYNYYSEENGDVVIHYDVFKGNYSWVSDYYSSKEFKKNYEWDVEYYELDTSMYEDYKVYKNEHGHMYIMVSSNQFVEFSTYELDIKDEEVIKIIYEKLFKVQK